jgi:hypothetical protein
VFRLTTKLHALAFTRRSNALPATSATTGQCLANSQLLAKGTPLQPANRPARLRILTSATTRPKHARRPHQVWHRLSCADSIAGHGSSKEVCEQSCSRTPTPSPTPTPTPTPTPSNHSTPAGLVGSWRGVEISAGYAVGEFDAVFTNSTFTFTFATGEQYDTLPLPIHQPLSPTPSSPSSPSGFPATSSPVICLAASVSKSLKATPSTRARPSTAYVLMTCSIS